MTASNLGRYTSLIILLSLALCRFTTSSQTVSGLEQNIWQESPLAKAHRKVLLAPPALSTGAVSYEVPIYTLKVENATIPFSIKYHSNGIKVYDCFAPLGYGWIFTPSLRVTRIINGRPDGKFSFNGSGSWTDQTTAFRSITDYNISASASRFDSERDIFYVHLPDRSLVLMLDNGKFIGVNCDEYRIETDSSLSYVRVTDPNGLVYNFSTKGECIGSAAFQIEWLLTDLTLPSGDKLVFGWSGTSSEYSLEPSVGKVNEFISTRQDENIGPFFLSNDDPQKITSKAITNTKNLSSVSFPGGTVSMNYEDGKITDLNVCWGTDTVTSAFFSHRDCGRNGYLLNSITVTGHGTHTFEYDSNTFANGNSQDYWGYYNGKTYTGNLAPAVELHASINSDIPGGNKSIPGADRSVSEKFMTANLLRKINLPSGGYVDFEYEPHKFSARVSNIDNSGDYLQEIAPTAGGGVRLKSIKAYKDSLDGNPIVKEYIYGEFNNGLAKVEAAPLLSTFISESEVPYCSNGTLKKASRIRVSETSDYMLYQTGLVPVWYSQVTEKYAEGKVEYTFQSMIPPNVIDREWGRVIPRELNTIFSHGPVEKSRVIYKNNSGSYKIVERTTFQYELIKKQTSIRNTFLRRNLTHFEKYAESPDFGERGSLVFSFDARSLDPTYKGAYSHPVSISSGSLESEYGPVYTVGKYNVNLYDTRYCGKTTVFTEATISWKRIEEIKYLPGTNIIASVSSSDGNDTIRTEYGYTDTFSQEIAAKMATRNIKSTPLSVTRTMRGCTSRTVYEMGVFGNVFAPKRIWKQRGSGEMWNEGTYSYERHGQVSSFTSAAGIETRYTWDQHGRHKLSETTGTLSTTSEWKPLVGIVSSCAPNGVTTRYEYDSSNRLTQISVDILGPVKKHTRNSGDGQIFEKVSVFKGRRKEIWKETTFYDGLGRKEMVLTNNLDSAIAVRTEYDLMSRESRLYCPVPVFSADKGESAPDFSLVSEALGRYYNGDNYPYKELGYEQSPREKLTSVTKAGEAWHNNNASINISTSGLSRAFDLRYRYHPKSDGVKAEGSWKVNAVRVTKCVDEDSVENLVYEDLMDNVICRETNGSKTYYVYNGYGDLCYILPPGGGQYALRTDENMQSLAFWYDYDDRGRCIRKKVPGVETEEYRYDPANRLVAEKNANLNGKWRLHFYDSNGRDVMQSVDHLTSSQLDELTSVCHSASVLPGNEATEGYSISPALSFSPSVSIAVYYDNYQFVDAIGLDKSTFGEPEVSLEIRKDSVVVATGGAVVQSRAPVFDDETITVNLPWYYFATSPTNAAGLVTGIYTGGGYEVYYYDSLGREKLRCATGFNSGRRFTRYGYNGLPDEQHCEYPENPALKDRHTVWKYDDLGRPVKKTEYICGGDSAVIEYSYDALGRLGRKTYGRQSIYSTYSYDIHGWKKKSVLKYFPSLKGLRNSRNSVIGTPMEIHRYATEELFYADSPTPCYNGNISAKSTLAGRYDYTYDRSNRLIAADWNRGVVGYEDLSTAYSYDERSNLLSVTRQGLVDFAGGPCYATLDDISIEYNGNQAKTITAETSSLPFNGRTGLARTGVFGLEYDNAGNLTADPSRNIVSIEYNDNGLPTQTSFYNENQFAIARRPFHLSSYDNLGNRLMTSYGKDGSPSSTGVIRRYHGDGHILTGSSVIARPGKQRIRLDEGLTSDTLIMSLFDGGYFDGNGKPRYYVHDYQGNIVHVLDGLGSIIQSTSYYPYGEPHYGAKVNVPDSVKADRVFYDETQPFLFGGKEHLNVDGQGEYDQMARRYVPTLSSFTRPDPKAADYAQISPYSFCAGNPIMYTDPTGERMITYHNGKEYEWKWQGHVLGFYDNDGNLYEGDDPFMLNLIEHLDFLRNTFLGGYVMGVLMNSNKTFEFSSRYYYPVFDGFGFWPDDSNHAFIYVGNSAPYVPVTNFIDQFPRDMAIFFAFHQDMDLYMALFHEMGHGLDWLNGTYDISFQYVFDGSKMVPTVPKCEIFAVRLENKLRKELNQAIRIGYYTPSHGILAPRDGTFFIDQVVDPQNEIDSFIQKLLNR